MDHLTNARTIVFGMSPAAVAMAISAVTYLLVITKRINRSIIALLGTGACLGGNGTLIGALANLAVAGIAERSGARFSFLIFTRCGFAVMMMSVGISHLYLSVRYFP